MFEILAEGGKTIIEVGLPDLAIIGTILTVLFLGVRLGDRLWGKKTYTCNVHKEEIDSIHKLITEEKKKHDALLQELNDTKNQIQNMLAHYESDQRFNKIVEGRLANLERIILQGNGNKSLITRLDVLESTVKTLIKRHDNEDEQARKNKKSS